MGTARFSRQVLKGKTEFVELFQNGSYIKGPLFSIVVFCKPDQQIARVAVCVSKKQGKAVFRNLLKRISRELLEDLITELKPCNVAVLPNRRLLKASMAKRSSSLRAMLLKATLLEEKTS